MRDKAYRAKVAKLTYWMGNSQTEAAELSLVCFKNSIHDMKSLAKYMGIPLRFYGGPKMKCNGFLLQGKTPRIAVNSSDHRLRKELTIAHEIGHHVLHGKTLVMRNDPRAEYQADVFGYFLASSVLKGNISLPLLDRNFEPIDCYRYEVKCKRFPIYTASIPLDILIQLPDYLDDAIADIDALRKDLSKS